MSFVQNVFCSNLFCLIVFCSKCLLSKCLLTKCLLSKCEMHLVLMTASRMTVAKWLSAKWLSAQNLSAKCLARLIGFRPKDMDPYIKRFNAFPMYTCPCCVNWRVIVFFYKIARVIFHNTSQTKYISSYYSFQALHIGATTFTRVAICVTALTLWY